MGIEEPCRVGAPIMPTKSNNNKGSAPPEERKLRCQNCDYTAAESKFNDAKDVELRHTMGDTFSDKECPECGALAHPQTQVQPKIINCDIALLEVARMVAEHDHLTYGSGPNEAVWANIAKAAVKAIREFQGEPPEIKRFRVTETSTYEVDGIDQEQAEAIFLESEDPMQFCTGVTDRQWEELKEGEA